VGQYFGTLAGSLSVKGILVPRRLWPLYVVLCAAPLFLRKATWMCARTEKVTMRNVCTASPDSPGPPIGPELFLLATVKGVGAGVAGGGPVGRSACESPSL
jgi:hypothetical protein